MFNYKIVRKRKKIKSAYMKGGRKIIAFLVCLIKKKRENDISSYF